MINRKDSTGKTIRDIRRATRKRNSPEEKIRIVLEVLRGEDSIAELFRREGINSNVYYRCSKYFMDAGYEGLSGDASSEATPMKLNYYLLKPPCSNYCINPLQTPLSISHKYRRKSTA